MCVVGVARNNVRRNRDGCKKVDMASEKWGTVH